MCQPKRLELGSSDKKPYERVTINRIFSDNHNWDVYELKHRLELRDVEVKEVRKMLECGRKGFKLFVCPNCGEEKVVHYGCNSRVCTHCGKAFTDKWSEQIARKTFDVKHRHGFHHSGAAQVILQVQPKTAQGPHGLRDRHLRPSDGMGLGREVTLGVIAVLHTYGRNMKWNPHVHALVTEGGFKQNGEWVDVNFFPFRMLADLGSTTCSRT